MWQCGFMTDLRRSLLRHLGRRCNEPIRRRRQRMWQGERKQRIRALLETFGSVSVERLAQEFSVSHESIRRDLVAMEQDGSLRRVHGGAVSLTAEQDASYGARSTVRLK